MTNQWKTAKKSMKKYEGGSPDRDVKDKVKWFWPKKLKKS